MLSFDIDAIANKVLLRNDYPSSTPSLPTMAGKGQRHIRYAKLADNGNLILAGTFGFVANDDQGLHGVASGKFDFRFG